MHRRNLPEVAALAVLTVFLFAAACSPGPAGVTPGETAGNERAGGAGAQAKLSDWDRTVEAAKREGRVILMGPLAPHIKEAIRKAFSDRYGVDMEMMSIRSAEYVPKLRAERSRGIYSTDVLLDGVSAGGFYLGPEGALEPLDRAMMMPEVVNPAVWYRGQLPFVDSNRFLFATQAIPKRPIALNSNQVKAEQISSYRDLLDTRWKGKMIFNDPTLPGAANTFFHALAEGVMSLDYLRELGRQELVIVRDQRLQIDWVAQGKYPILLGFNDGIMMEFVREQAPITVMSPKAEPTFIVSSVTVLHLMNKAPHPNAARLFVNWFASKEGQTVLSRVSLGQSGRVDVPTDHLPAWAVRQPGEKYVYTDTEESIAKRDEYRSVARSMWGHLMK
ncbi:MAG: extracellular solute-binding protein [Chloroflexi bacterium]|nr:extracellular solute-binding protein [Chloroflexota bacterium]